MDNTPPPLPETPSKKNNKQGCLIYCVIAVVIGVFFVFGIFAAYVVYKIRPISAEEYEAMNIEYSNKIERAKSERAEAAPLGVLRNKNGESQ